MVNSVDHDRIKLYAWLTNRCCHRWSTDDTCTPLSFWLAGKTLRADQPGLTCLTEILQHGHNTLCCWVHQLCPLLSLLCLPVCYLSLFRAIIVLAACNCLPGSQDHRAERPVPCGESISFFSRFVEFASRGESVLSSQLLLIFAVRRTNTLLSNEDNPITLKMSLN
jgi:hypothetical protein